MVCSLQDIWPSFKWFWLTNSSNPCFLFACKLACLWPIYKRPNLYLILPTLQNPFDQIHANCFLSQAVANDFISTVILCALLWQWFHLQKRPVVVCCTFKLKKSVYNSLWNGCVFCGLALKLKKKKTIILSLGKSFCFILTYIFWS